MTAAGIIVLPWYYGSIRYHTTLRARRGISWYVLKIMTETACACVIGIRDAFKDIEMFSEEFNK